MSPFYRLKTNMERSNVDNRLQYKPDIVEFYLSERDLENPLLIRERIRELKAKNIKVYLHHPPQYKGRYLDILSSDSEAKRFYMASCEILAAICEEEGTRCVVHAHYAGTESSSDVSLASIRKMRREIAAVLEFSQELFVWEDTIEGLFCHANPYLLEELIVPLELPLTVDVSHTFIGHRGNNEKLIETLGATENYARYFHLVDSKGKFHDSLPLGKGLIDWKSVKPFVEGKDYIFEIQLEGNHSDCTPMIESARFFSEI